MQETCLWDAGGSSTVFVPFWQMYGIFLQQLFMMILSTRCFMRVMHLSLQLNSVDFSCSVCWPTPVTDRPNVQCVSQAHIPNSNQLVMSFYNMAFNEWSLYSVAVLVLNPISFLRLNQRSMTVDCKPVESADGLSDGRTTNWFRTSWQIQFRNLSGTRWQW